LSDFPLYVLREYAFAADGERGLLVGPRGEIAWMCAPRWDSDAVFSTLVGGAGIYAVTPTSEPFVWGGFYEPGGLIWHSRWTTTTQRIECREALALPASAYVATVIRRVLAVEEDAHVRVVLDVRAGFGKHTMTDVHCDNGIWSGRSGRLYWRWSGASSARQNAEGQLECELKVDAGGHHDLVLEISDRKVTEPAPEADDLWTATSTAWSSTGTVSGTLADRDAQHAVAILGGLTSIGGGMVAGATMALPEHYERGKNYDYRYAWIRDQCYVGQAAATAGQHDLLDAAVQFVADRLLSDGDQLKPAYTVDGGPVPDERSLKLSGYPGGSDKVGNWVNQQFQLDAFGEALLLFAAAARLDRLGADHWVAATQAVEAIERRHNQPDAGIWELDDDNWTHSRLACVAGLRAIAEVAPAPLAARWMSLADNILAHTGTTSVHPSGRWQRSPDDPRIDSALLFPAVRGALPAHDPRTIATLDAALSELAQDGYMYRFREDDLPLGMDEGAFLLCGFMTSLALHQQGREVEAVRWFERNRAACGTPGVFAEEFSVQQRQLRGNLPQAFVHALLLESSVRLTVPWGSQR
jgi:GH15 family glucan-1,4-alpha-glucosidase